MTQEEKAKAYDKALKVIKECNPDENGFITIYPQEIFPELEESEDERIRKEIIEYIKTGTYRKDWLAWLEKQGEQKQDPCEHCNDKCLNCHNFPCIEKRVFEHGKSVFGISYENPTIVQTTIVQSIEPKFKVGNWYQCTKDFFGKGVTFDKNNAYYCAKEGCLQCEYGCHIAIVKDLYDNFKLWTIQEAKDGDILATNDWVFIFKRFNNNGNIICYCHYDYDLEIFKIDINSYMATGSPICPATKEQRDLLFAKMKEAGYEWDVDKKELKKIEQKPVEWSEEDEKTIEEAIEYLEKYAKECVQGGISKQYVLGIASRLDHLYPQKQWKPSEEQMQALKLATELDVNVDLDVLERLYQQLKAL